jgi:hypothetical protein
MIKVLEARYQSDYRVELVFSDGIKAGSHHENPRIPLRCIRATCLVPAWPAYVGYASPDIAQPTKP